MLDRQALQTIILEVLATHDFPILLNEHQSADEDNVLVHGIAQMWGGCRSPLTVDVVESRGTSPLPALLVTRVSGLVQCRVHFDPVNALAGQIFEQMTAQHGDGAQRPQVNHAMWAALYGGMQQTTDSLANLTARLVLMMNRYGAYSRANLVPELGGIMVESLTSLIDGQVPPHFGNILGCTLDHANMIVAAGRLISEKFNPSGDQEYRLRMLVEQMAPQDTAKVTQGVASIISV